MLSSTELSTQEFRGSVIYLNAGILASTLKKKKRPIILWISGFEKVIIIFGNCIPMIKSAFLLISAQIHFSKQNKAHQSLSSQFPVSIFKDKGEFVHSSLQGLFLCRYGSVSPRLSRHSFPILLPAVLLWQWQEWEKLEGRNWDLLPESKDKFWSSLDNPGPKPVWSGYNTRDFPYSRRRIPTHLSKFRRGSGSYILLYISGRFIACWNSSTNTTQCWGCVTGHTAQPLFAVHRCPDSRALICNAFGVFPTSMQIQDTSMLILQTWIFRVP